MEKDIFDRSRLRSDAARRVYERAFGPEVATDADKEKSRSKILMEKRDKFNLWLMRAGRNTDEFTEEEIREFEEQKRSGYNGVNPPVIEQEEPDKAYAPAIDSKFDPVANAEQDLEEKPAVDEEVEIDDKVKQKKKKGSISNTGGDFLADLKKQYAGGADENAGQADAAGENVSQSGDLSDKVPSSSQEAGTNGSAQAPTQTPGFVKTSKGPLTSKVPQISLEEYLTYMEDSGVVGEEKNLLRFGFRLGQLKPTFIDGKAGSGKTYIIKAGLNMLPKEYILTVDCASNTSLFIDEKEVEKYPIIWFKEFQKVAYKSGGNNELLEMIKSWAEGEDAKRRVNDHGKLKFQTITEKCVISCIATENDKKGRFDRDKETLRRFDILHTDESQEHVKKVMEYKARLRVMNSQPKKLSQLKADQVKRHFKELVDISLDKDNELLVSNPFAESIKDYIPETPRAISYMDMYYDYVEGCTKFHYKNRLGKDNLIISDLADQYIVYRIYHDDFCDMLQKLDDLSEEEFEKRAKKSKDAVNWKAIFESGYETVKVCFSEEVAEEWVARQLVNNKITVWDPILKKDVVIVDYDNPTPSSQAPKQYGHQTLPSDPGAQYAPPLDAAPATDKQAPQAAGTPDYIPAPEQASTEAKEEIKEENIEIQPVDEITLDEQ